MWASQYYKHCLYMYSDIYTYCGSHLSHGMFCKNRAITMQALGWLYTIVCSINGASTRSQTFQERHPVVVTIIKL